MAKDNKSYIDNDKGKQDIDYKIHGSKGADVLYGTAGNDKIYGSSGKDGIFGLAGNDKIKAGSGDDVVFGGTGNDKIKAGSGNDTVFGEEGNDKVYGGKGNDLIFDGTGNDNYHGNSGNDIFFFDSRVFKADTAHTANPVVLLDGDDGTRQSLLNTGTGVLLSNGCDKVDGGSGYDIVDLRGQGWTVTIDHGHYSSTSDSWVATSGSLQGTATNCFTHAVVDFKNIEQIIIEH